MPDVEFVVYGEVLMASDSRVVQRLAKLRNLRMMGPFNGVEALPFQEFPLFLYTSQWDGTPTIVIAAALASIPIVASCVGGVGDIVSTETGFPVYDVEDIEEYIRSIRQVFADGAVAESRAIAARQLVQTEYTVEGFESGLARCFGYMSSICDHAKLPEQR
jgi:glycosyltransferase involved in cell wall biosynthesis